jgi:hypothetical protein
MDSKPQEEDAAQLKFPKGKLKFIILFINLYSFIINFIIEFENAETLLISEVHMLMENRYFLWIELLIIFLLI